MAAAGHQHRMFVKASGNRCGAGGADHVKFRRPPEQMCQSKRTIRVEQNRTMCTVPVEQNRAILLDKNKDG